MRHVHLVHLDKTRPAVVLTREQVRPHLKNVTVAPITSTVRGIYTEIAVGPDNGLDHECAVSVDTNTTIPVTALSRRIGYLLPHQERALSDAISFAFDLGDG